MQRIFLGKPCQKILDWIFRPYYNINVESSDLSKGGAIGSGEFRKYKRIVIKAIPNSAYKFVNWNDGNTEQERKVIVTKNKNYVANFEEIIIYYTLKLYSNDETLGTVEPIGTRTFEKGQNALIKAIPRKDPISGLDKGKFIRWSDGSTQPQRTVLMDSDKVLTAIFEENLGTINYKENYKGNKL